MTTLILRTPARRVSLLLSARRVWTPRTQQTVQPCFGVRTAATATAKRTAKKAEKTEKTEKPAETTEKTEKIKKTRKTTKKAPETGPESPIPPFSLAQLRDAAVLCGRNASDTKAALRSDLEEAVLGTPAAAPPQKPQRVLSIDMGVRNLAYCLLAVDARGGPAKLAAWERLSLIDEDEASQAAADAATKASLFTPPRLAGVAARLVRDRLLALAPTHVVIERQRSRSGGGMAVLEWTMRVNSLEAMLHGIFAYHQVVYAEENKTVEAVEAVEAVSPKRVSVFLLRGGIGDGTRRDTCPATVTTKKKDIKDVKEAFVAGLLHAAVDPGRPGTARPKAKAKAGKADLLLSYDDPTRPMVEAYLARWDAKQKRLQPKEAKTKTKKAAAKTEKAKDGDTHPPALSKIDDLADCVAQGLIWLEWERNKAIFRDQGAEALLEEKPFPA